MTAERQALAAHQLWERCRDSTSVPLKRPAVLGDLGDGLFAGAVRPALGAHRPRPDAATQPRGCLEDADDDRAQLTVASITDADAEHNLAVGPLSIEQIWCRLGSVGMPVPMSRNWRTPFSASQRVARCMNAQLTLAITGVRGSRASILRPGSSPTG